MHHGQFKLVHDLDKIINTEFQRPISIDGLNEVERYIEIKADEQESEALALRFSVLSISKFNADVWLSLDHDHYVYARIKLSADVLQSCVFTLEPLLTSITDGFELNFLSDDQMDTYHLKDYTLEFDRNIEPPGIITDRTIDLGAVISEYLCLTIDPYPRIKGMDLENINSSDSDSGQTVSSPFAALKQWRGKT